MNSVIHLLVILLFASSCISAQTIPWDDLRVTFSFGDPSAGFFKLPRTAAEATAEGWTKPPEDANPDYQILCPDNDPSVCVIYGQNGDVNGIEIGIQMSDVANSTYPFANHPTFVHTMRFGYHLYVITAYTVKPGTNKQNKLETGDGVWLEVGPQGVQNFEIPRLEAGMTETKFTLQNCVPGMGVHYYYDISPTLSCDDFEPMFALYKNGEMIGFGVQTWGRPTPISKNWFEPVPPEAIRPTVPDAPQCMVDRAAELGLVSLHVFFIDEPWTMTC